MIVPVSEALAIREARLKEFNSKSAERIKAAEDRFNENVRNLSHSSEYIYLDRHSYVSGFVNGSAQYYNTNLTDSEFDQVLASVKAAGYYATPNVLGDYKVYLTKPKLGIFGL